MDTIGVGTFTLKRDLKKKDKVFNTLHTFIAKLITVRVRGLESEKGKRKAKNC